MSFKQWCTEMLSEDAEFKHVSFEEKQKMYENRISTEREQEIKELSKIVDDYYAGNYMPVTPASWYFERFRLCLSTIESQKRDIETLNEAHQGWLKRFRDYEEQVKSQKEEIEKLQKPALSLAYRVLKQKYEEDAESYIEHIFKIESEIESLQKENKQLSESLGESGMVIANMGEATKEVSKPTVQRANIRKHYCDCKYNVQCESTRQYVQQMMRDSDPSKKVENCDFYGYIEDKAKEEKK